MLERALALHQRGQIDKAIGCYREAIARQSGNFEAHHFLGMALFESGQIVEAIEQIEGSIAIRPDYAQAYLNLGRIHAAGGQPERAGMAFSKALQLQPENIEILATNGMFAVETGRDIDAMALFKRTIELSPQHLEARHHLARLQLQYNHPVEAIRTIEPAIELERDNPHILILQAKALYRLERLDEARAILDRIDGVTSPFPEAMVVRAQIAEETGHFEAAKEWYLGALRHMPENSGALAGLIGLRSAFAAAAQYIESATSVAHDHATPSDQRRTLLHALGKYHDRSEDYDRAFAEFERANALVRSSEPYDAHAMEAQVDTMIDTFDADFFLQRKDWGLPEARPIFIVGMPRSGTTLTEQILDAHPEAAGAGELGWFPNLAAALRKEAADHDMAEPVQLIDQEKSVILAEGYLEAQRAATGSNASSIVDKLPLNFLHVGLIRILFPGAPIVACLRHPMDNCLSCFMEGFAEDYAFATDLRDLGHFYRQHDRLIAHWSKVAKLESRSYEDVTERFAETTRDLLEACGLPWDDACLRYNESHAGVRTPSKWQVRQPIYRTSVERWRHYEKHLGPLQDALGF